MHSRTFGSIKHLAAAPLAGLIATMILLFGAASASAASHPITISMYAYHPGALTVAAGDTVTWTNLDTVGHDVTVTRGPVLFHSPLLSQGQSWSYTFTVAGPYTYICSVHPDMTATLTVTPAVSPVVAAAPARMTTRGNAPGHATEPTSTVTSVASPNAAQTQSVPLNTAAEQTAINPLLLVGGALCAVLIFCLLAIASRPIQVPGLVNEPSGDEVPLRTLPPPPPA